ncbi:MAG: CBS domain-containing protein [Micrococcales bacterium]|nr:CBS domain-containing protein [Micrococcales bacterium]
MSSNGTQVFVARLAGTKVFDPLGDQVGRVRDVVVVLRARSAPSVVGLVVEVPGRRRVFVPMTRVTAVNPGQVITTGLVNLRRFEPRASEHLVVAELLDRTVELVAGGQVTIVDVAIEQRRDGDWTIARLFVRERTGGKQSLLRRGATRTVPVEDVHDLLGTGHEQPVDQLLAQYEDLKPTDLAEALHALDPTRRLAVAAALPDERLADALEELPEDHQVEILRTLEPNRAADVLDAMQPDDAADLLGDLPEDQARRLLELMEPEEARDVRRLLAYEDDTAGGLMTTVPVVLGPETSIAEALAHVRRQDLNPALASMVFVARPPLETPTGRFVGVVHLQRMLREPPHEPLGNIVDTDIEPLSVAAPLMAVSRELAAYNLLALPVVDQQRRLLGAVSIDDVLDHLLPEDWRETDDPTELEADRA